MTLQELLDIACRYLTSMADAMVAACLQKAVETGERLDLGGFPEPAPRRAARPVEEVDWERMVRCNTDTRTQHV